MESSLYPGFRRDFYPLTGFFKQACDHNALAHRKILPNIGINDISDGSAGTDTLNSRPIGDQGDEDMGTGMLQLVGNLLLIRERAPQDNSRSRLEGPEKSDEILGNIGQDEGDAITFFNTLRLQGMG